MINMRRDQPSTAHGHAHTCTCACPCHMRMHMSMHMHTCTCACCSYMHTCCSYMDMSNMSNMSTHVHVHGHGHVVRALRGVRAQSTHHGRTTGPPTSTRHTATSVATWQIHKTPMRFACQHTAHAKTRSKMRLHKNGSVPTSDWLTETAHAASFCVEGR